MQNRPFRRLKYMFLRDYGSIFSLLQNLMGIIRVFHIYAFPFQYVCKVLWANSDRPEHEFWDVVAAHKLSMIAGVGGG